MNVSKMNELKRQIEYVLRGDGSKSKTAKDVSLKDRNEFVPDRTLIMYSKSIFILGILYFVNFKII